MKGIISFLVIFSLLSFKMQAQSDKPLERKGFIFGASLGASSIQLNTNNLPAYSEISASFPNFKIGSMISKRTAIVVNLPGTIYKYKDGGRERDRGFEGIIPSVQFWVKNRWWTMAGIGIGLDAPAFYDIETEQERKFYFGSSFLVSSGCEVYQKNKFAIDLQARLHYANVNLAEGKRNGMAVSFLVGFNLY